MEPFAKAQRKDDPLAGPWDELTSAQAMLTADIDAFGRMAARIAKAWKKRVRDKLAALKMRVAALTGTGGSLAAI